MMTYCRCKCRLKCGEKIPVTQRETVLTSFYQLDENSKNSYIFSSIVALQPYTMRMDAGRHRQMSFAYYITVQGVKTRVCKKAFAALHQITNNKIDHISRQILEGKSAPHPCERGRHGNRPQRISSSRTEQVKEHINQFPAENSHYSRHDNPNRQYLAPDLNINRMYQLYRDWCSKHSYDPVSARAYRDIFNTQFNLGFGSPKSDTCTVCDRGSDEDHKAAASASFAAAQQDREFAKNSDNVYYATFDLQKTLPLPRLSTSIAFYLRQVWLYNLGIHVEAKSLHKPFFCIWTEGDGGRGCSEIASCLLAWVDMLNVPSGCRLICWSDSCAGQNKNFCIVCLWQYLIKAGKFQQIEHKFPVSGHSYLDSDRDFGHIEKSVREKANIYSVDEYQDLMACSQVKARPVVTRMAGKLYCLKDLPQHINLINRTSNTAGEPVHFRDIRWIKVVSFGEYSYKHSLSADEEWKSVNIMRSAVQEIHDGDIRSSLTKCHGGIKKAKLDDIKKQLPYIPQVHQDFYTSLDLGTVDNNISHPSTPHSAAATAPLRSKRLSDMGNKRNMHAEPKRRRVSTQNKENDAACPGKPQRGK